MRRYKPGVIGRSLVLSTDVRRTFRRTAQQEKPLPGLWSGEGQRRKKNDLGKACVPDMEFNARRALTWLHTSTGTQEDALSVAEVLVAIVEFDRDPVHLFLQGFNLEVLAGVAGKLA